MANNINPMGDLSGIKGLFPNMGNISQVPGMIETYQKNLKAFEKSMPTLHQINPNQFGTADTTSFSADAIKELLGQYKSMNQTSASTGAAVNSALQSGDQTSFWSTLADMTSSFNKQIESMFAKVWEDAKKLFQG